MRGRLLVVAVLFLTVCPIVTLAGTTGKIRGKILDKQSGEALIGANVLVAGTSLGAAANLDGEFIILNVPPGSYQVVGSFLGYQPLKIGNVQVSSDLTTEVNFNLTPLSEGVLMQEIIVQRTRELVNKNATNAIRIQTGEDLKNLPVRGIGAALALNPGLVAQDGNLYIRGGRPDEVGYYLEGASTRNVLGGGEANRRDYRPSNLTVVIPEAMEEFQVQAGGYNAQYGGSNAGIIRQTLKSGTGTFKGSLQLETDRFTGQNESRLGTYSYGYSNYVATLGGPIVGDKVKFFIAGENQFDRDWAVKYWDGFRFTNLPSKEGNVVTDTLRLLEMQPGNIPGMGRNRYTGNGTLTFDFNPIIIRVGGSISRQRQQGTVIPLGAGLASNATSDPSAVILNLGRMPITETSNLLLNTKFTHLLSSGVLYEVNVNYSDDRYKRSDPDHGDNFLLYNDSLANAALGYRYKNYTTGPTPYYVSGFYVDRYGTMETGTYRKSLQSRLGGSFDLTAQLGTVHEFKVGGSMDIYTVRFFQTNAQNILTYRQDPDLARTPGALRDFRTRFSGRVNNYGYDVYGNKIDKVFDASDPTTIDGAKRPAFYGAYIQDKIEYADLVVNAGLRLDVFNTNDFEFVDDPTTPGIIEGPDNPSIETGTYEYRSTGIKKVNAFKAVSPRLGFSFPVSDRTVFHVQYGKFIQPPGLNTMYEGRGTQAFDFAPGNYNRNPVGHALDPERTTQYEVGFTQQITDAAAFDITGYYKDISGQIQIRKQTVSANSVAGAYFALVNGDFATTKGLEISFRLRRVNRITASLNYTFADASGTGSTVNSAAGQANRSGGLAVSQFPTVISPLDFSQAHRGSINFDYRFGENEGGPILSRLGLNLLLSFNSGHPYTVSTGSIGQQAFNTGALVENQERFANPAEAINASVTPWNFNVDLRLDKTVSLGPLSANIYLYVQNLLNTRNVINVYRRTGNAYDDGFLTNPELSAKAIAGLGPTSVDLYRAFNLANGAAYTYITGNELWSTPRQMRFGVKLEM